MIPQRIGIETPALRRLRIQLQLIAPRADSKLNQSPPILRRDRLRTLFNLKGEHDEPYRES